MTNDNEITVAPVPSTHQKRDAGDPARYLRTCVDSAVL